VCLMSDTERLRTLLCKCGHEWFRHDPEDGECDAPAFGPTLDVCPCRTFRSPSPDLTLHEYVSSSVLAAVPSEPTVCPTCGSDDPKRKRPALSEEAAPTEPTYEVFTASDGLPAIRMVEEAAPCAKVPCERAATAEAERDALKGQVNRLNHLLSLRSNVEERMAAEGIPVGTDDLLLLAMGATPLGEATTACPTCADAGFVMGPIGERLPCPNDAFHRPSEETTP
jgi:predicted  nucleic acid-binding Zn-ribbon protein